MALHGISSGWRAFGLALALIACAGGSLGCTVHRRSHFAVRRTEGQEHADACAADVRACRERCESGDAATCNLLGVQLELGTHGGARPHAAALVYERGCAGDYAPSCTNLAWLVLRGNGVPADPPLALVLFQRAYDGYSRSCAAGSGSACLSAVDTMDLLEPREDEDAVVVALLERGCALGEARACASLAP